MLYARLNEKKASSISKQVTSNNKTCDTLCLTNMRQKIYDTFDVLKMNKNHATFCQSGSLIIFQKPTQLVRWPESLEMIRSRSPRAKRAETSMRKIFVIQFQKNMKTRNLAFSPCSVFPFADLWLKSINMVCFCFDLECINRLKSSNDKRPSNFVYK